MSLGSIEIREGCGPLELSGEYGAPYGERADKDLFLYAAQYKSADFGNSSVWFTNSSIESAAAGGAGLSPVVPEVVDRTGGSRLWGATPSFPTTKHPEALIYGRRMRLAGASSWQSAAPTYNPQEILRIQRNQPLQSMAAGFVCYPAAAGGCRHCRPAASGCRLTRPLSLLRRQLPFQVSLDSAQPCLP